MARKFTNELISMVEDGVLSWESIARAALCYMSEDDVADMARSNEMLPEDDDIGDEPEIDDSLSECDGCARIIPGTSRDCGCGKGLPGAAE